MLPFMLMYINTTLRLPFSRLSPFLGKSMYTEVSLTVWRIQLQMCAKHVEYQIYSVSSA